MFSLDVAIVSHFSIWECVWQYPQTITPVANGKKCKWIRCLPSSTISTLTHIYVTSFGWKTESFVEIRMEYFVSSLNFPRTNMKFPKTCRSWPWHWTEGVIIFTLQHFTPAKQFPILTGFSDTLEKKIVCCNFQNSNLDFSVLKAVNGDTNHWVNPVPMHTS